MTAHDGDDGSLGAVDVDLLAHPYRRYLLWTLYLSAPPLPLADVADLITVRETGEAPERHRDRRLRIYMALYHDHLPELVDAGVVDYRQAVDVVDLGPLGPHLEPVVMGIVGEEATTLAAAGRGAVDDAD
jgi:hypothetical protein